MLPQIASLVFLTAAPILAQDTFSITATPTLPPSVTAVDQISQIFATSSTVPDLGNPALLSNYPACAAICTNTTIAIDIQQADYNDINVICGPEFSFLTAGCEAATCDADEQAQILPLEAQLCGPLYNANATLSSAVSAAEASAPAIALAATEGKDPTDLANFPECALPCITQNDFNGCGGNIALCVCQDRGFNEAVGPCQTTSCDIEGLYSTLFIAEKLCEPFGGILTNPIDYNALVANGTILSGNGTNAGTNVTVGSPAPSPFVGEGTQSRGSGSVALILTGFAVIAAYMIL
ncbi:MAG: hypothetical protein Q9204_003476 [Flavoplaca sp. TL-2023a]